MRKQKIPPHLCVAFVTRVGKHFAGRNTMVSHGNLLKSFLTTVFATRTVINRLPGEKIKAPRLFPYSLHSMLWLLPQCLEMIMGWGPSPARHHEKPYWEVVANQQTKSAFLLLSLYLGSWAYPVRSRPCHSCMEACPHPWTWSLPTLSILFPTGEDVMVQAGRRVLLGPHFPRITTQTPLSRNPSSPWQPEACSQSSDAAAPSAQWVPGGSIWRSGQEAVSPMLMLRTCPLGTFPSHRARAAFAAF